MPKRVINSRTEPRDPAPPIFITLIKVKANEVVSIAWECNGLTQSLQMEDAKKERPVAEFYENMMALATHVRKQAELPDDANNDVRATGIRISYDGPQRIAIAQMIGWRQLHNSSGGYALSLPAKTLGTQETSQTDGDPIYPQDTPLERGEAPTQDELAQEEARLAQQAAESEDAGPTLSDGSNRVCHSREATRLIQRQIELAKAYIGGQRAEITIEDAEREQASSEDDEEDNSNISELPESQVEYEVEEPAEAEV